MNDDRLRVVEAAVYGYILAGNESRKEILAAEGFGESMNGPARERVIEGAIRDRDFLRAQAAAPRP